jgi:hypothetical protein
MFTPKILIRVAAACVLFFALGHSIGHFSRHNNKDAGVQEVLKTMDEVKYDMFGQMRTYEQHYTGLSLNLIFTLIALAFVLWAVSNIVTAHKKASLNLLLPIALCLLGFSVTSFLYFFPVPGITCLVSGVLLLFAMLKLKNTPID